MTPPEPSLRFDPDEARRLIEIEREAPLGHEEALKPFRDWVFQEYLPAAGTCIAPKEAVVVTENLSARVTGYLCNQLSLDPSIRAEDLMARVEERFRSVYDAEMRLIEKEIPGLSLAAISGRFEEEQEALLREMAADREGMPPAQGR